MSRGKAISISKKIWKKEGCHWILKGIIVRGTKTSSENLAIVEAKRQEILAYIKALDAKGK